MSIRRIAFLCLLIAAGASWANPDAAVMADLTARTLTRTPIVAHGRSAAKTDTTVLFGGAGTVEGKFENALNPFLPDWNGWTHVDNTAGTADRGDFAKIWAFLPDIDVCHDNTTPAVGFIDDGVVVPCTGGTLGTTWTYGPGGYCVNVTGGCDAMFFFDGIDNMIVSPPIALTAADRGVLLEYDAYLHIPIENGIFHYVRVRTSADGGVTWGAWEDQTPLITSDTATWRRRAERLDALIPAGSTHLQVALGVLHFSFGLPSGVDPTPAPYLDNVTVKSFPVVGPTLTAYETWLPQDGFPASGTLDPLDPGAHDVPVLRADGGQGSVMLEAVSTRPGAELVGPPVLHYQLRANTVYDAYRAHPTSGTVVADSLREDGVAYPGRWIFELPATDFLYPGDVMHFYLEATDSDGAVQETSTLPADLSAFGVFAQIDDAAYLAWDQRFVMRALPGDPDYARLLIWDDGLDDDELVRLGEDLESTCAAFGLQGVDLFVTRSPGPLEHNGLGDAATAAQLAVYPAILYLSGRSPDTLQPEDMQLLGAYLDGGGRLFLFSENLAEDLDDSGSPEALAFLADRVGVDLVGPAVVNLIGGQYAPELTSVPFNEVFADFTMVHYGGCPEVTDADAVSALPGTQSVLAWTNGLGTPIPGLDAATLRWNGNGGALVSFPWPLLSAYPSLNEPPPGNMQVVLLNALLSWAGLDELGCVGAADDEAPLAFTAGAHPNPFNPEVVLSFTAPRDARAVVEVFDVRGAKVRTLQDGPVSAGTHRRTWDGRDDRGQAQASGVYFARIRVGERLQVEKLALVR